MCLWRRAVTYAEFQFELRRAGLTVREFASLVGMNRNSVSNYAQAAQVPHHLAVIVVLMAELGTRAVDVAEVLARVPVVAKKARGRAAPGRFGGDPQSELELRS